MKLMSLKRNHKNIFKFGLPAIFALVSVFMFFQYIHKASPALALAETPKGLPIRIVIPRINLDASIEEVNQISDGLIGPPTISLDTSWYGLGPKPGEEGTSVIYGYVHWEYGYTARFSDLRFLKPGDIVSVKDDTGMMTIFRVSGSAIYDMDMDLSKVSFSDDGESHLNLITYDGSWDKDSKSYSKRLVVFTDKSTEVDAGEDVIWTPLLRQHMEVDNSLISLIN